MTVTGNDPAAEGDTFLDPDHAYHYWYQAGNPLPAGLIESHRLPDGRWCSGSIAFKGAGDGSPEWTVILREPLTLSPSILCRTCHHHFWIEGGRVRLA